MRVVRALDLGESVWFRLPGLWHFNVSLLNDETSKIQVTELLVLLLLNRVLVKLLLEGESL